MGDQVPADVAERRRDLLINLHEPIAAERLARFVGGSQRVLVCGRETDGNWYGRTEGQGPDIDGVTYLGTDGVWRSGRMADVLITGADAFDLFAEIPN
jgi:ribosomal protein S12 methylthiotransferase